jgi:hypothetical protein
MLYGAGGGGDLLHVDMSAHNKSGIAYRDWDRRPETDVDHKREPHQQPRLFGSASRPRCQPEEGPVNQHELPSVPVWLCCWNITALS